MRQNLQNAAFRAWRALFGYDVFVSYSSRNAAYAEALEDRIRRAGFRVFRDRSGTETGDRLDALLRAARRSRMLVAVVTEDALQSDWVRAEIDAFLAAPGARRLVGIFFSASHPQVLPGSFAALKSYRGIRADPADLDPPAIRGDLIEQIERAFRAVRMAALRLGAVGLLVALIAAGYWMQLQLRSSAEARDHWLRGYEAARGDLRSDLEETALAQAAEADPDAAAELMNPYREARARRFAAPEFRAPVPHSYILAHIGDHGPEPYLVFRDSEDGSLWLDAANQRTLIGSRCGESPRIASEERSVAFTCGSTLFSIDPGKPSQVRKIALGVAAEDLAMEGGELRTLEGAHSGVPVVRSRDPVTLELRWSQALPAAPAPGESGLCRGPGKLAWAVNVEDRKIVVRRWERGSAGPVVERFATPDSTGSGLTPASWVNGAAPSPDCDRFFVDRTPFSALGAHSRFEFVRVRVGPVRLIDSFDPSARSVAPLADRTGYEALYLTSSHELRAFVLAPPVIRDTRVRTLASGVRAFQAWPAARFDGKMAALAVDSTWLLVFVDGQAAARYPVLVKDPVRLLVSPDGRFAAVQGEDGIAVWQAAEPCGGGEIPPIEALSTELGVHWVRGREPQYRIPVR